MYRFIYFIVALLSLLFCSSTAEAQVQVSSGLHDLISGIVWGYALVYIGIAAFIFFGNSSLHIHFKREHVVTAAYVFIVCGCVIGAFPFAQSAMQYSIANNISSSELIWSKYLKPGLFSIYNLGLLVTPILPWVLLWRLKRFQAVRKQAFIGLCIASAIPLFILLGIPLLLLLHAIYITYAA